MLPLTPEDEIRHAGPRFRYCEEMEPCSRFRNDASPWTRPHPRLHARGYKG